MERYGIRCAVLAGLLLAAARMPAQNLPYLHAPAIDEYALHNPAGTTILADGRLLKPVGRHFPLAKWPHGLVMTQDGKTLFVASGGTGQLITGWDTENPIITPIAPPEAAGRKARSSAGGRGFLAGWIHPLLERRRYRDRVRF